MLQAERIRPFQSSGFDARDSSRRKDRQYAHARGCRTAGIWSVEVHASGLQLSGSANASWRFFFLVRPFSNHFLRFKFKPSMMPLRPFSDVTCSTCAWPPPPWISAFLASSLAAVTSLVWSTRERPQVAAALRTCCRTRTTSSPDPMGSSSTRSARSAGAGPSRR